MPPSISPTTGNPTATPARTACLTREECESKSQELNAASFSVGNYPTKGCFMKGQNAIFSPGTVEEMSSPDMRGNLQRIWCDDL